MTANERASRCGVPGFQLQDSKIFIKVEGNRFNHIRHGGKPMLSVDGPKGFLSSNYTPHVNLSKTKPLYHLRESPMLGSLDLS